MPLNLTLADMFAPFDDGSNTTDYTIYKDDPVGFCKDVLGETLTPDIEEMLLSVRDNDVTICMTSNGVGKTHAAARVAAWWFKVFVESQVYTAAAPPERNLRKLLWGEIGEVRDNNDDLFTNMSSNQLNIERNSKSFITGVTIPSTGTDQVREASFSGKHSPNLLFICDEGDAIPDAVYSGIESCLSGEHGRLLIMFNPRARAGKPYRMIRDGVANVVSIGAFTHPNVVTGENIIPGAVDRATTVRRINQWTRPFKDGDVDNDTVFELPDYLVGAIGHNQARKPYPPLPPGRRKVMEPQFSYMTLGRFPAQGTNQLISQEWVDAARTRWDLYTNENGENPPEYVSATVGFDVAEFGDDNSCLCFRYGGFVPRMISWEGVDTIRSGEKCIEYCEGKDVSLIVIDSTGLGAGLAPQLVRDANLPAIRLMVASSADKDCELGTFAKLNDQLAWEVREWLSGNVAMIPPDEELLEELSAYTYQVGDDGKVRVSAKSAIKELIRRSPDKFDALKMSLYNGGRLADMDLS